jgi:CubicO group peptidase (beta-lactamase class C family)
MMRLGILYLQEGVWNGERLLSREWVKQAGAQQIATGIADPWSSGYGYQFWMIPQRENAFRADGAYGQYSLVFPKENAVVGIQCCEENDLARFGAMLRHHLLGE